MGSRSRGENGQHMVESKARYEGDWHSFPIANTGLLSENDRNTKTSAHG